MNNLLAAIVEDDRPQVAAMLAACPGLARQPIEVEHLYEGKIFHWIYAGDTALHLAAAGYRVELAQMLLASGADPNAANNRRRSTPLHYAADGIINDPRWNPHRQVETLRALLGAGATINAQDKNGATALHRAVRTRCAEATTFLLSAGCNFMARNKPGSTPLHLAVQNTGRGGSGTDAARIAQRRIIEALLAAGACPRAKDGNGRSVFDCAQDKWIGAILGES